MTSQDLSSVICEIAAVQAQPFQTAMSADPGPTTTPAGESATYWEGFERGLAIARRAVEDGRPIPSMEDFE